MNPTEMPNPQDDRTRQTRDDQNVRALLVSPFEEDVLALRRIFDSSDWDLCEARNYREALDFFIKDRVPIIVCNPASGQGDWKDLVSHLAPLLQPPRVFIISEPADLSLATEVSEQAAGDLIMKPFDDEDVTRRIRSAWLAWRRKTPLRAENRSRSTSGPGNH